LGKEERKSSGLGAHQYQPLFPRPVVRKGKKRVALTRKIRPGKRYSMMRKSSSLSTASDKVGLVKREANCAFCVDQSYSSFQVAEISAQRSMVETTLQLSSNSSFSLETSAIGEREK